MTTNDEATVTLYRFDPSMERDPRYESYQVPLPAWKNRRVIDVISYIYENFAPDLSFREPCRQGICGACTMMVNKKQVLACTAIAEQEMTIEPQSKFPVLKDLIVDQPKTVDDAAVTSMDAA
jgi:succinate dehydrogenase / fumarate reductase iron-sulfur subunit